MLGVCVRPYIYSSSVVVVLCFASLDILYIYMVFLDDINFDRMILMECSGLKFILILI